MLDVCTPRTIALSILDFRNPRISYLGMAFSDEDPESRAGTR